jgi:hypothetical protein
MNCPYTHNLGHTLFDTRHEVVYALVCLEDQCHTSNGEVRWTHSLTPGYV